MEKLKPLHIFFNKILIFQKCHKWKRIIFVNFNRQSINQYKISKYNYKIKKYFIEIQNIKAIIFMTLFIKKL